MYVAAQRVETPDKQGEGINVFVHRHTPGVADWGAPDLELIARSPGPLVLELISVNPGGNSVTSYLDVVAPDEMPVADVARAVEQLAVRYSDIEIDPLDGWGSDKVHMRFYSHPYTHPDPSSEFRRLKDRIVLVLRATLHVAANERSLSAARAPNPLRVYAESDTHGVRYTLDAESRRYLKRLRPDFQIPASLGVTHENQADLASLYGSSHAYREFAVALTGLSVEQMNAVAGLRLYGPNDNLLWSSENQQQ